MIAFLKSHLTMTIIGMTLVAAGSLVIVNADTMVGIVVGIVACLTGFVVLLLRPFDASHTMSLPEDEEAMAFAEFRHVPKEQSMLPNELENGMRDVVADIPDSFYTALKRR